MWVKLIAVLAGPLTRIPVCAFGFRLGQHPFPPQPTCQHGDIALEKECVKEIMTRQQLAIDLRVVVSRIVKVVTT